MKLRVFFLFGAVATSAASVAQIQSLTTLYDSNNSGPNGGAVFFDARTLGDSTTVYGIDVNTSHIGAFTMSVYRRFGSYVGFENTTSGWQLVATGVGNGLGLNQASPVTLNQPFILGQTVDWGLALVMGPEASHAYSGTGSSPAPGTTQYQDDRLRLTLGAAQALPFTSVTETPRIWNGTIHHWPVPEPASMIALGIGALALVRRKRR